jgi:ATP/maltotriose-dependent transcriptional regulator MalT
MPDFPILRTKLNPPRPQRHTLTRPRVDALLREALDHRVTIVQASTGYGKSTALANLADANVLLFWYSASEGDADPQQFLMHLIAAFRLGLPALPDTPLALLQDVYAGMAQVAADALLNTLNDLLTSHALLIIDDYHLAASNDVNALTDHFLAFLPPNLRVIVSTRYPPLWDHLASWRARGQALEIKRDALAFTRDEITTLFRDKYAVELSPRDVEVLAEKTEGWPIALQLVWQEIRAKPKTDMASLLGPGSGSLDTLFAYRSEERRVGKECRRLCRSRWSPYH